MVIRHEEGVPHLNKDKIESNLSVPGIQGHQENALIKSFEMSLHLICLRQSKIPANGKSNPESRLKVLRPDPEAGHKWLFIGAIPLHPSI